MADNSAEIAVIESILNSGATSVTVDGTTTTYDHNALRKRLKELRADDDNSVTKRRPTVSRLRLS